MYKNNSRDSSKFKVCSPLQLSCNLTGNRSAIPYWPYRQRWLWLEENGEPRLGVLFWGAWKKVYYWLLQQCAWNRWLAQHDRPA